MHSQVRNRHLLASDLVTAVAAPILAFAIRFEGLDWAIANSRIVLLYILLALPARIAIFVAAGLYRRLWRHASVGEMRRIVVASLGSAIATGTLGILILPLLGIIPSSIPLSVAIIDAFLTGTAVALPRMLVRTMGRGRRRRRGDVGRPTLIVGAGETAKLIVKEMCESAQLALAPIGYVDDNPSKHRQMLYGLPVLGGLADIRDIVARYGVAEIVIAMPSAPGPVIREVVRAALDCGIPSRTVPSFPEILARSASGTSLRDVQIEDLLRRETIETDLAAVAALATNETVLVTGAGGSIGSELCRQIARLAPHRLVLLGHGENSIFDILNELRDTFGDVEVTPVIADVRDRDRVMSTFATYRPHAVFHAAAHKHVPLMEENIPEAVTNNVVGTRNVVDAALASDVEHFVLISTDKAVRPTSVMGATKRVAEQIVQHAATQHHHRNFVSVRFGNVLGSRGSVVPTFLRQIRSGGPVMVTHPEMRRYFMTIPESVQLVLQAGALGRGGEVFVLDMGEPVRIVDLATDLIRLSGLEVERDIKLHFSGMRPGEKLYEELFFSAENVIATEHPKVLRARNGILTDGVLRRVDALAAAAQRGSPEAELRQLLQELVPDFRPHPAPSHHDAQNGEQVSRLTPLRLPARA